MVDVRMTGILTQRLKLVPDLSLCRPINRLLVSEKLIIVDVRLRGAVSKHATRLEL